MKKYYPTYKTDDMEKYIKLFLDGREEHGRYLSFEHCYSFFQNNSSSKDKEIRDQIALHLFAYLASWGMLRNSFLMYKDYTYLTGVVDVLSAHKKEQYNPSQIMSIKEELVSFFKGPSDNPTFYITDKPDPVYVRDRKNWDTLTSKILMGTLGCVPAYDDYFKGVAKKVFGMNPNFSEEGLKHLMEFVELNSSELNKLQKLTETRCGFAYPIMKIIDMYFWQKGYAEGISMNQR